MSRDLCSQGLLEADGVHWLGSKVLDLCLYFGFVGRSAGKTVPRVWRRTDSSVLTPNMTRHTRGCKQQRDERDEKGNQ